MDSTFPLPSSWWNTELDTAIDVESDPTLAELHRERRRECDLYALQDPTVRAWIDRQAERIADALRREAAAVQFELPARLRLPLPESSTGEEIALAPAFLIQRVSAGWTTGHDDLRAAIRRRLALLEQSPHAGLPAAARLLRLVVARRLIAAPIPEARRDGGLEAGERELASLRQTASALSLALSLAPYFFTDSVYRATRQETLGRILELGWSLGSRYTDLVIRKVRARAEAGRLDRGLRLSLPYFDEYTLAMRLREISVIPEGRIAFVPAFVALAARKEQDKAERDPELSPATRLHLLAQLKHLEQHFGPAERGFPTG